MPISAYDLLIGKHDQIRDHVTMTGAFPFRPTLFVGLGGTGSQAVAKQKELFLNLVAPQLSAGVTAQMPDINPLYAFRAFDTNGSERQPPLSPGVEWHQLRVGDLEEFYEYQGKTPFFEPWLVKKFPMRTLEAGCGGFRNLGRLALISNITDVNRILIEAKDQITAAAAGLNVVTTKPLIHVFCSLSGGTGSGMLLDVCFLLRQLMPGVEIIGHIAVLDGLPGITSFQRRTIATNTFCALKELNAYMSGAAPSMGETLRYSQSVQARTCEPMNYCLLLSSYRNDNTMSLPRQEHVSSFMARVAFMISGYSFTPRGQGRTPDFAGVMVDVPRLAEVEGGAHACYVIPGFAQAHFPVAETAALFSLTKTRECLQHLRGGMAREGDADAAAFFAQNNLERTKVQDRIGRNPAAKDDSLLAAPTYNEILEQLFEKPSENSEQILALAASVTSTRLVQITATIRPNLEALLAAALPAAREKASQLLEDRQFLGLGTVDFLADLKKIVAGEWTRTDCSALESIEPDYLDLPRKWNALHDQVADAVTSEGIVDRLRDWYNRRDVRDLYIEFLNRAEIVLLDKARADLAKDFYHSLEDAIAGLLKSITNLITSDLDAAIQVLHKTEQDLATALARQDNAEDASVQNVRSFNVMTEEWRNTYLKSKSLPPETVFANLVKGGWQPIEFLEVKTAADGSMGMAIAADLVKRVEPFFETERNWTPVQVLRQTAENSRVRPSKLIETIYSTLLQPQMQISAVKNRTHIDLDTLVFSGGIDQQFSQELQTSGNFQNVTFNSADNQENNRVNFTTITLPVPLAGCNLVTDKLSPHYNSWLEDVVKEEADVRERKVTLHHCFPGSSTWRDPTGYTTGFDAIKLTFARCLAMSEILPPSAADLEKMNLQKDGPKEKLYALFQVGESQYWLWPFFPPDDESAPIPGRPCNIGKNVVAAFDAFSKNPDYVKQASAWVQWLEEHWSDQHSSKEMRALVNRAQLSLAERKGRSGDLDCIALWDDIAAIIRDWKIG